MDKKVIDLSTLTSIADAIRTKEGSTDKITVSDFASRIEALPTGSESTKTRVTDSGEFTLDTASQTMTFDHDLGVAPQFVRVWTDDDNRAYNRNVAGMIIQDMEGVTDALGNSGFWTHCYCGNSSNVNNVSQLFGVISTVTYADDSKVQIKGNSSGRTWGDGITYYYTMWADVEE